MNLTAAHIEEAKEALIEHRDAHLDSLVARLNERLGRKVGYLVIFDPKADTPWEDRGTVEELDHEGVTVVVVRA